MPSSSELHVDRPLTNVSVAYRNDRLVADRLVPPVQVKRESDLYYVYTKDSLRLPQSRRADTAESNRSTWHVSTSSYTIQEEALHDYVSDRQRDNADNPLQLDVDTTESLTEQLLVRKDFDLTTLMTTTVWSNNQSNTSTLRWTSNTTTSNPITQIDSAATAIAQSAAKMPNVVVLAHSAFIAAKEHVSVVDRIKYTSTDSVTPGMLARLFNVNEVLVAGAIINSGGEGIADSMDFIWGDYVLVAYMERAPGLRKPSAMYQFRKAGGMMVNRWREAKRRSDGIEVSSMYQLRPVSTDCGYLIKDVV